MRRLSTWKTQQDARWIALVNPPLAPCTERLMQEGINPKQVDVLNIPQINSPGFGTMANAVSTTSSLGIRNTHIHQLRRLQLACQRGQTQLFLVRNPRNQRQASPAPVRIAIDSLPTGFEIRIFKQPGTNAKSPVVIPLELHWLKTPSPVQRKQYVKAQSSLQYDLCIPEISKLIVGCTSIALSRSEHRNPPSRENHPVL